MTVSNLLSLLRLLLAIPIWILFDYYNSEVFIKYWIFALCVFAAITDILDGFLARKLNQVTEAGKIIDPLADKIAMAVVVIRLTMLGELPFYYLSLIVIRDLLIFLGGIFVTSKIGKVLPSNILGKATVLIIGIVVLLTLLQIEKDSLVFNIFYYFSLIMIVLSFIAYVIRANEYLKRKKSV
ncbi:Phosphatidylglycerophosphate synthase [Ignavibacterium album JCM 16511]|uniref:CDP-diacylglycerol--glycerol-3-phosphate 3-phosphatidyltransferase n=1 Tax=Ignavibacterium album (strain DSM 19864 / JCM 16511 / NBRC 101810 / Mat9-16) TaxID=945713 RepID=I0AJX8_IGNAJ|nr:Phosphatidylglycerophosphate synthase [Ignavibacterium album JCM 16511]